MTTIGQDGYPEIPSWEDIKKARQVSPGGRSTSDASSDWPKGSKWPNLPEGTPLPKSGSKVDSSGVSAYVPDGKGGYTHDSYGVVADTPGQSGPGGDMSHDDIINAVRNPNGTNKGQGRDRLTAMNQLLDQFAYRNPKLRGADINQRYAVGDYLDTKPDLAASDEDFIGGFRNWYGNNIFGPDAAENVRGKNRVENWINDYWDQDLRDLARWDPEGHTDIMLNWNGFMPGGLKPLESDENYASLMEAAKNQAAENAAVWKQRLAEGDTGYY